jgi:anti-sigma regulatory factor (Ser/Thr protein kinase)/PAS domain-containing protein
MRLRNGLWLGLLVVVVIAVGDLMVGDRVIPLSSFLAAPLVAAAVRGTRVGNVIVVTVVAVVTATLLGILESLWPTVELFTRLGVIAMGGVAGVVLLREREKQEQHAQLAAIEGKERAELQTTLSLLRTILDATTDPIFAKDLEGRYTMANRAVGMSIGGDPALDVIGCRDADLLESGTAAVIEANDRAVLASGLEQRVEETIERDRFCRTYVTTKAPLLDETGAPIGLVGVARDITNDLELISVREQLYEAEHSFTTQLQRSLLGSAELEDSRIESCARYRPASEGLLIGGDWYDIFALPGGLIGLIVGDAVGHGVPAAMVMGQLRSAGAALAHACIDPARTLEVLDEFACTVPDAASTTCLLVVLDPANQTLTYSSAGHPPPLVMTPSGEITYLEEGRGPPLAALGRPCRRLSVTHPFLLGSTVMLYTDGLIERRGESLDLGLDRLAAGLRRRADMPLPKCCDEIVDELLAQRQDDDMAIVGVRLVDLHSDHFHRSVDASPGALRPLRRDLTDWFSYHVDDPEIVAELVLAAGEAVANSVEHAYSGDGSGRLVFEARIGGEDIRMRVHDHGRWRAPVGDTTRGRGLNIIRAVTDELTINRHPSGTTVMMHRSLPSGEKDSP